MSGINPAAARIGRRGAGPLIFEKLCSANSNPRSVRKRSKGHVSREPEFELVLRAYVHS